MADDPKVIDVEYTVIDERPAAPAPRPGVAHQVADAIDSTAVPLEHLGAEEAAKVLRETADATRKTATAVSEVGRAAKPAYEAMRKLWDRVHIGSSDRSGGMRG